MYGINPGIIRMVFDYISMYSDHIVIQDESEYKENIGRLLSIKSLYNKEEGIGWQIGRENYDVVINVRNKDKYPVVEIKQQLFIFSDFKGRVDDLTDEKSIFLPDLVRESMQICPSLDLSKSPFTPFPEHRAPRKRYQQRIQRGQ